MRELIESCKNATIKELEKFVANRMFIDGGYSRVYFPHLKVKGMYRARLHNHIGGNVRNAKIHLFTEEKEFWNPPKEFVKELGRCNNIGQSMFYSSNSWETAILEVKPKVGDYLSMAIFELIEDNSRSVISPIGIQYLSKVEDLAKDRVFLKSEILKSKEAMKIDDFLDELFHLEVADDEKYKYKLSIAVTNCLMKDIVNGDKSHKTDGVMYPSIVRNKQSYNLVYRPEHVREMYELIRVQTFKIVCVTDETCQLELKRNGKPFRLDSNINGNSLMNWETVPESLENFIVVQNYQTSDM